MVSDERCASIIFDQLFSDDWFMSYGQRNNDCVDYCIAACLQGMNEADALEQLQDKAMAGHHKLVDAGKQSKLVFELLPDLVEEHFERIWPYAKGWVRRGEWKHKLIHDYDFEEE